MIKFYLKGPHEMEIRHRFHFFISESFPKSFAGPSTIRINTNIIVPKTKLNFNIGRHKNKESDSLDVTRGALQN